MTDITVKLDPETGAATIELRGAAVAEQKFRLRDAASERFLTRRGWSKTPSFLPGEAITAADFTVIALDPDLARRIGAGTKLVLEQPTSNIFANLAWPGEAAADDASEEQDDPETEGREPGGEKSAAENAAEGQGDPSSSKNVSAGEALASDPAPEEQATTDRTESSPDAHDDEQRAEGLGASTEESSERADPSPASGNDPAATAAVDDGAGTDGSKDEDRPAIDEPVSLEPAIRDEVVAPYRSETPAVSGAQEKKWGRSPDESDDDDDDAGWPWGRLVAAALLFTVLGSVLTYFWQSSAYDNELRTAMRAVEAQRDEIKADLEKRLAEAEARAGKESSAAVTAAEATAASLTQKTESLARDRDEARSALAEQQARVKTLEERLTTAQGEIDSLKQAAEADATEQTAVFNDRIDALGKDLDTARKELEAARAQLAERDQTIAKSTEDLKEARDEIASLRQASEANEAASNAELEGRIRSLSDELDKAAQDLATRDLALRDVQAKLSVANVQIEALKQVAGKATAADLERTTLTAKVAELTGRLEKSEQELAAKDTELSKIRTSLDAANAMLSKNAAELEQLKGQAVTPQGGPEKDTATERLKQERDLLAKELSAMTESMNALKAERDRLIAATGASEQNERVAAPNAVIEGRAVWGATAIDQSGAVYSLQNQINEDTASENVVALCKGKSNGRCEPLRTYSNACFSLARIEGEGPRNDNFGFSMDKDWKKAESGAIRQCEELGADCTVRFTVCSPDGLSKPAVDQ